MFAAISTQCHLIWALWGSKVSPRSRRVLNHMTIDRENIRGKKSCASSDHFFLSTCCIRGVAGLTQDPLNCSHSLFWSIIAPAGFGSAEVAIRGVGNPPLGVYPSSSSFSPTPLWAAREPSANCSTEIVVAAYLADVWPAGLQVIRISKRALVRHSQAFF